MTVSYEEAVREAEAALTWRLNGEPLPGDFNAGITISTLRALLSGPPEPSEEEVAALVAEHVRKDFGVLKVGMKTLVQGIQALYRSRRA